MNEPGMWVQQATLLAAAAVAQATPMDLLRELQAPGRMPGGRRTGGRGPSNRLRDCLTNMAALQQQEQAST